MTGPKGYKHNTYRLFFYFRMSLNVKRRKVYQNCPGVLQYKSGLVLVTLIYQLYVKVGFIRIDQFYFKIRMTEPLVYD